MADPGSIVVGLEVGTSKVCAAVGEVSPAGVFSLLGLGQSKSRGVRKGEITDAQKAIEDVRNAIAEAEQMADVEIRSAYLGVTGAHVRGETRQGLHPIVSEGREITAEDVQDAVENARARDLPHEHVVIHTIRQDFSVDDHDGVANPEGMVGSQLLAHVHVVHGQRNRIDTGVRAVQSLQLEVDNVVFNGLASALAVLTTQQKEMGVLVVDLGAGVTEYAVYGDALLRGCGAFAVGGDHVTNDLAIGLKIPLGRAEQLKVSHGAAEPLARGEDPEPVALPADPGLPERTINLAQLRLIQSARVEETLELVARAVGPSLDLCRAGVVLCGGGARMVGIEAAAQRVFKLPATVGRVQGVSGPVDLLGHPEFAAAIGLARFGAMRRPPPSRGGLRRLLGPWFR
jgi:cell division protein FtsA